MTSIIANLQSLLGAKQAARVLVQDSAKLLASTGELANAYQEGLESRGIWYFVLGLLALATVGNLVLLGRAVRDDAQRRATESARARCPPRGAPW